MQIDLHNQRGFSLVELAISVTVIGILLAGVVKGREVLESSRAVSIAAQFSNYKKSFLSFQDIYGALPGDMSTAQEDIPNCDSSAYCSNGDGNLTIGTLNVGNTTQTGTGDPEEETTQFWKHLALAGMITDIQVNADPDAPAWGVTHPKAYAINAGVYVGHATIISSTGLDTSGHWLIMSRGTDDEYYTDADNANAVSPIMARALDRKLDDGVPDTGRFIEPDTNARCDYDDDGLPATPTIYKSSYQKDCTPTFKID